MTYYRVRLPDNSPDSQIGCFTLFVNARLMADANPGYCVFKDNTQVWPSATPEESYDFSVALDRAYNPQNAGTNMEDSGRLSR